MLRWRRFYLTFFFHFFLFLSYPSVSFLGIFVCSQSGYHSWEDVEKVAIIPRKISPNLDINQILRAKVFIILLYFWLHSEIKLPIWRFFLVFFLFPSLLATENLQNHFFFLIFNFAFWRNLASKKSAASGCLSPSLLGRAHEGTSVAREADLPAIFHKTWQAENPEFVLCHTWQTFACHCGSPSGLPTNCGAPFSTLPESRTSLTVHLRAHLCSPAYLA
jgi:hypothetical protein